MLSRCVHVLEASLQRLPGKMTGEPREIQLTSVTSCGSSEIASAAYPMACAMIAP